MVSCLGKKSIQERKEAVLAEYHEMKKFNADLDETIKKVSLIQKHECH